MTTTPRSSTATLIKALAIMAEEDRSEDGIAGAALLEASQRLGELVAAGDKLAAEVDYRNQPFYAWEAVSR